MKRGGDKTGINMDSHHNFCWFYFLPTKIFPSILPILTRTQSHPFSWTMMEACKPNSVSKTCLAQRASAKPATGQTAHQTRLLRAPSNLVLNTSKDGSTDFTRGSQAYKATASAKGKLKKKRCSFVQTYLKLPFHALCPSRLW